MHAGEPRNTLYLVNASVIVRLLVFGEFPLRNCATAISFQQLCQQKKSATHEAALKVGYTYGY